VDYKPQEPGDLFEFTDNGRRGLPLMGCDCVACFGMCIKDHDARTREINEARDVTRRLNADEVYPIWGLHADTE